MIAIKPQVQPALGILKSYAKRTFEELLDLNLAAEDKLDKPIALLICKA